jgi:hypothetical protein
MSTTIDFKDLIDRTIGKMLSENALESQVQGHVETMLKRSVDELFRSYGPITKQIEQQLAESINLNGLIDIQSYNARLASLVQSKLDGIMGDMAAGKIAKVINDALKPAPKTIRLSALIEKYIEQLREDEDDGSCSCDGDKQAIAMLRERDRDYCKGYYDLILSSEPVEKYDSPDIFLMIDGRGELYHLRFKGQVASWLAASSFGEFEKSLWHMLACGTTIDRDCNPSDCDLNYSNQLRQR